MTASTLRREQSLERRPAAKKPRRRATTSAAIYMTLAVTVGVSLGPVYWMIVSSLHPNTMLTRLPPPILSMHLSLTNYGRILTTPIFRRYYENSAIVAICTVLVAFLVGIPAAYAMARFPFRGKNVLMAAILSVQMFPIVAILIGLFRFYAKLHLLNTYPGLVLAHSTLVLPFAIWFLKAFFEEIPRDLEEAAYLDGASRSSTLLRVMLPLARPALLAVGVYAFLVSWDDFVYALTLTTSDNMRTLPVGIALSFIGEYNYDWAGMMTISVVASAPVLLAFLFLQRFMIAGLTRGAVKG